MRLEHPEHPGRAVRLCTCLNLWPGETLDEAVQGLETIALPLRARLAQDGEPFGVGLYLAASLARELARDGTARARLVDLCVDGMLDPFTYNAFPYGGFHAERVKEAVFRPSWGERERAAYTLDVAAFAAEAWRAVRARDGERAPAHVSISTHCGAHGPPTGGERDAFAREMIAVAEAFAEHGPPTGAAHGGPRLVLGLEPEPRSSANDLVELALFRERLVDVLHAATPGSPARAAARERTVNEHLGLCLDLCHAAVEFEPVPRRFGPAAPHGPLAKVQFSSALALHDPAADEAGRTALLAMAEPRYLHQVTGRVPASRAEDGRSRLVRAGDLSELAHVLAADPPAGAPAADGGPGSARADWLACDEWRCHFHVPVDRERLDGGLATTRAAADAALAHLLADPDAWGSPELHVEIETYTWDVLPAPPRTPEDLVDGLEAETRHVLGRLAAAGWRRDEA